jgi:Tfp pilus assembly pilus retraction ATPase PilT
MAKKGETYREKRFDKLEQERNKQIANYNRYHNQLDNSIKNPNYNRAKANQYARKAGKALEAAREIDKEILDLANKNLKK